MAPEQESGRSEVRLDALLGYLCQEPWAILPEALTAIAEDLALRLSESVTARAVVPEGDDDQEARSGSIAVVPVRGVMQKRMSLLTALFGGTSTDQIRTTLRQLANDSKINSIVLDIDSPGGAVAGTPELAADVREVSKIKPVVAVANGQAASAAYWVASSASELVVSPSSSVGSIGVVAMHDDLSNALEQLGINRTLISAGRYKTEGNPYEPLSDEARAHIQGRIDQVYRWFVASVAEGRGVQERTVREQFGQGRTVSAEDAVNRRMADRIGTLDETVARLASQSLNKQGAASGRRGEEAHMSENTNEDQVQADPPQARMDDAELERIRQEAYDAACRDLEESLGAPLDQVRTEIQETRRELHTERVRRVTAALQGRGEHESVKLPEGHAFAPAVVSYVQPLLEADVDEEAVVAIETRDGRAEMSISQVVLGILNAVAEAGDGAMVSMRSHGVQDHSKPGERARSPENMDEQIDAYLRERQLHGLGGDE